MTNDGVVFGPLKKTHEKQNHYLRLPLGNRYHSPGTRPPDPVQSPERSFLAKYDIANGITERLTFGNHSTYLQDISQNGNSRYLLMFSYPIISCLF